MCSIGACQWYEKAAKGVSLPHIEYNHLNNNIYSYATSIRCNSIVNSQDSVDRTWAQIDLFELVKAAFIPYISHFPVTAAKAKSKNTLLQCPNAREVSKAHFKKQGLEKKP